MISILSISSPLNANKGKESAKRSRNRDPVIGSCSFSSATYSHDYFHCPQCSEARKAMTKCTIAECLCKGEGYLFPIGTSQSSCDTKKFAHQFVNQSESVRIHLDRKKQLHQRILHLYNTKPLMLQQPTAQTPSLRQKRDRDEENNHELFEGQSDSKKMNIENETVLKNTCHECSVNKQCTCCDDSYDEQDGYEIRDFPIDLNEIDNKIDFSKVF